MKKKENFLKEMMKDLEKNSKILKEAYVFDDEDDDVMMDDDMSSDMYGEAHHEGHQMEDGDSAEEQAMHAQEVIQHEPIIAKIRDIAIDGLKKYADNPTSPLYAFFKKVFMEADKTIVDNGGKK